MFPKRLLSLAAFTGVFLVSDAPKPAYLVRDINQTPSSTILGGVPGAAVLGSHLVFPATSEQGASLWVSDGTEAGTTILNDFETPFWPASLTAYGDAAYFWLGNPGGIVQLRRT